MDRAGFEALRDLPGKVIRADIAFAARRQTSPAVVAENIVIENSLGTPLRLHISYNPEVGSKTFNVVAATDTGTGAICRLDVDGPAHRPAGRCHKHSLQTERCIEPSQNLRTNVQDMPALSGRSVTDLFSLFCTMAQITHVGTFTDPSVP
jgi:hypothetical protein